MPTPSLRQLIAQRAQIAFLMAICAASGMSMLSGAIGATDVSRSSLCELLNQQAAQSSDSEVSAGALSDSVLAFVEGGTGRQDLVKSKLVKHMVAAAHAAPHRLVSPAGYFGLTTLIEMPEHLKLLSGTPPPAWNG